MAATVPAASSVTDAISYTDLYARWERGNWSAMEIDLAQDGVDWNERLTPEQRRGALWMYTLFFHGEDSVADNLSPYIDAAPTEEQTYFLTTQQVDEARHSIFFNRFFHEVMGVGDGRRPGRGRDPGPDHLGPPDGVRPAGQDGRRVARGPVAPASSRRPLRSTT